MAALHSSDARRAVELALAAWGPEIEAFLSAVMGDRGAGAELFAEACADVMAGMSTFQGKSSFRCWFYAVARNAARRAMRDGYRRKRAHDADLGVFEQPLRSVTPRFVATDWKRRLHELREALPPDERALLILRVDRAMDWHEISHVMAEEGADVSPAALRKRFERVKARLKALATEDGWFSE
ncbi:MAG: sigma-70 family RNA polymerase sigma factor [Myxococcales bacterium]|nr:sigma-70 family RNA polymerase sigma factor [Myxococcales bacterium]MDP3499512.1 sigma-70 family RNA polymerase sigma factor [Myxococcales bacterium]